jgi:hypothetical protein
MHQKAILVSVISEINKHNRSELKRTTAQLATIAILFAMCSSEYLKVQKADQQRAEPIRLRNILFFKGSKLLKHNHQELEFADCIALTFEHQKKDEKMDTVLLMVSKDLLLCPARAAAAIARQIMKYPGSSKNSPISTVLLNGIIDQVTSSHMVDALRDAVVAIGEVTLGVKKEEVGTHSIRSGTAMAIYHGKCPVFMIMSIGC